MHRLALGLFLLWLIILPWDLKAEVSDAGAGQFKGLEILPRLGVGVEYGGFVYHDDFFTSRLRRCVEMDVLQYGRHIFYMRFDEETLFGTPRDKWDFNLLRYQLAVAGYRYDLGEHYLGFLYTHWCYNPFLTEKFNVLMGRTSGASVYFLTFEFLKKSLRLGMKDRNIVFNPEKPFEFLGTWHYGIWINKEILNTTSSDRNGYFNFDWVLQAKLRLDFFRYRQLIPYVEVEGEMRTRQSTRCSARVETGVRYHLRDNLDLTPFFQWARQQEILRQESNAMPFRRTAQNSLYGGLRCEVLLDSLERSEKLTQGWQFLPEIHGSLTYLVFLWSRFFGWGGNIEVDFEMLRYGSWTAFFYTDLLVDTQKVGFGLEKAVGRLQYGLTYGRDPFFVEGFVEDSQRLDFRNYNDISERAHLAGLRLGTKGMKPGHFDDGIPFSGPNFQWLNKWNAQGSVGHYFQNRDWQYLWDLRGKARWDALRWYFIIPYLQGEVRWLAGGGSTPNALEYAVEPGLRFHGGLDVALYFRFQHRENARYFRGPADNQGLFGIMAMF